MITNYFKIAWRNLWKHRLFSLINVFGLASGLTVCLLAIAHIKGAFDYDNFHPNRERTYRVLTNVVGENNDVIRYATSPMPLGELLKQEYTFVEEAARVVKTYGEFSGNHKQLSLLCFAVDPAFFQIFGYKLAQGQPATEPNTVVLTRETAEKFFGTTNPIGKTVEDKSLGIFTVTGVLDEQPARSHLRFDMLLSLQTPYKAEHRTAFEDWRQYQTGYTYVLLKSGTLAEALNKVLPTVQSRVTKGLAFSSEKGYSYRAQRLADFSPSYEDLVHSTYEPQIVGLLIEMGVGLITLLLAAFNYINLTLACSLSRAREVGIRKVSGAVRWQVVGQFMAESVVLSMLALGLAIVMLELVKPMAFVQQWLVGGVKWDWTLWAVFVLFSIVAGLLAGLVPARVLSAFEPAQVLRSQTGLRVIRGISLRKSLIVVQFAISLIAMIGLLSMVRQMNYMATADYGFRREGILNIPLNEVPAHRLMNELDGLAGVEQVAATSDLFGHNGGGYGLVWTGSDSAATFQFSVDPQFASTFDLDIIAGQGLPAGTSTRSGQDSISRFILINEQAVKAFHLGTAAEAVGQQLRLNDSTEVQVAGVVKDFPFATFVWDIKPLVLFTQPSQFRYLTIRVTPGTEAAVLADVQQIWKRLAPYAPFEGQWYNDFLYQRHSHTSDTNFMLLLIGLAFSIACLGLLGMVTYNTQTRTKEVGVRKVMGAEVIQLVWLLSRDFVKLLGIAALIALPLGYLAGYAFLINFAYHVSIGFETLGLCVGVLLVLGSATIGFKTYRAALSNPTESLRSE